MQPLPEQRLESEQDIREFIFDTLVDTPDVNGIDAFFNDDEHGYIVSFRFRRKSIAHRISDIQRNLSRFGLDQAVSIEPFGEHTAKVVLK